MSDQLVAEAATRTKHNKQKRTNMLSAEFESAIPATKWLQTYCA